MKIVSMINTHLVGVDLLSAFGTSIAEFKSSHSHQINATTLGLGGFFVRSKLSNFGSLVCALYPKKIQLMGFQLVAELKCINF
mgnify:CR=1 FL=1